MNPYMIVKNGRVQFSQQNGEQVMPLFTDYEEARKCANKQGATVAQVGSVDGETLSDHIEAAYQQGCRSMLITNGIGRFFERK